MAEERPRNYRGQHRRTTHGTSRRITAAAEVLRVVILAGQVVQEMWPHLGNLLG